MNSYTNTIKNGIRRILSGITLASAFMLTAWTAQAQVTVTEVAVDGGEEQNFNSGTIRIRVYLDSEITADTQGSPYILLSNIKNFAGGATEFRAVYAGDGRAQGDADCLFFQYAIQAGDYSTGIELSGTIVMPGGASITTANGTVTSGIALPVGEEDSGSLTDNGYKIKINTFYFEGFLSSITVPESRCKVGKSFSYVVYGGGNLSGNVAFLVTVHSDEDVAVTIADQTGAQKKLSTGGGEVFNATMSDSGTMTITVTPQDPASDVTIRIRPASASGDSSADLTLVMEEVTENSPTITRIFALSGDATYANVGDTITIGVEFSERITHFSGNPLLYLNVQNQNNNQVYAANNTFANYAKSDEANYPHSGKIMYFTYTVKAGDYIADLDATRLSLNGATITCSSGSASGTTTASLPKGAATGSLASENNVAIRTVVFADTQLPSRTETIVEDVAQSFIITRGAAVNADQTFSVTATPANGDKVSFNSSFTIPAGSASAEFVVTAIEATEGTPQKINLHPVGYTVGDTGGDITFEFTITPSPTRPAVKISGVATLNEGDAPQYINVALSKAPKENITVTITSSNPNSLPIVDCDLSVGTMQGDTAVMTFPAGLVGPYTITVDPRDGLDAANNSITLHAVADKTYAEYNHIVRVLNVNPTFSETMSGEDGWVLSERSARSPGQISWSAKDVSTVDLTNPLKAEVDFGDGTPPVTVNCTPTGSGAVMHTYMQANPNGYNIRLTITDKDGGSSFIEGKVIVTAPTTALVQEFKRKGDGSYQNSYKGLQGVGEGSIFDDQGSERELVHPNCDWRMYYNAGCGAVIYKGEPKQFIGDDGLTYDSFVHTWIGEDFVAENVLDPTMHLTSSMVDVDENTTAFTVGAVFARERYSEDNYADIDLDDLPDDWEFLFTWGDEVYDDEYPFELTRDPCGRDSNNDNDYFPALISAIDEETGNFLFLDKDGNLTEDINLSTSFDFLSTGIAFVNRYEVRGTHPGLNAKKSEYVEPFDEPRQGSYDLIGIFNENDAREFFGTDPTKADTDADKLTDGYEYFFWRLARTAQTPIGQAYDPTKVIEGIDIENSVIEAMFNPCVQNGHMAIDIDQDGLSNFEEMLLGTNPIHWDTDKDGMNDGWEALWGLNPIKDDGGDNLDKDFMAYVETGFAINVATNVITVSDDTPLADPTSVDTNIVVVESIEDIGAIFVTNIVIECGTLIKDTKYVDGVFTTNYYQGFIITNINHYAFKGELRHFDVRYACGFDPRVGWKDGTVGYCTRNRALRLLPTPSTKDYSNYEEHYLARWSIDHGLIGEVPPLSLIFMSQPVPDGIMRHVKYDIAGSVADIDVIFNGDSETIAGGISASANGEYSIPYGEFSYVITTEVINDTHGCDSDKDGMPDGWELYTTNPDTFSLLWPCDADPNLAGIHGSIDIDFDGLSNREECHSVELCDFYYGVYTNSNGTFSKNVNGNWYNKWWPSDPNDIDTDGDHLTDYQEGDSTFRYQKTYSRDPEDGSIETSLSFDFGTTTMTRGHIPGGGLNPCAVDTDMDYLPDAWEYEFAGYNRDTRYKGGFINIEGTLAGGGMDGTYFDSRSGYDECLSQFETSEVSTNEIVSSVSTNEIFSSVEYRNFDFDGDGLENYQEYWVNAVSHFQYDSWQANKGYGKYDPKKFFNGTFRRIRNSNGKPKTIGTVGFTWDWSYAADAWEAEVSVAPANLFGFLQYPYAYIPSELRPQIPAPPIYPIASYASTDPRLADTDADNMDDYYEMFHGLNPILGEFVDKVGRATPELPAGQKPEDYDFRTYPWLAGMPNADPDQDGLPNWEEALSPNQPAPANYNTDPSPIWFTDISNSNSFVNLYYKWGSIQNYWTPEGDGVYAYYPNPATMNDVWDMSGDLVATNRPSYVYSFEVNEGFDTDNDNISDRAELTGITNRVTDPQNSDRPALRKAAYLDGKSAFRTRALSAFGIQSLRSWTLEVWVRPEEPATGKRQIILERPVQWIGADTTPVAELTRRTFRLGLDEYGKPFVEFNNGAQDFITEAAIAKKGAALEANEWYHIAATMDGYAKKLKLYVNGELVATKSTSVIPYTGFTYSAINGVVDQSGSSKVLSPRWAPIVVGAADANAIAHIGIEPFFTPDGMDSLETPFGNPKLSNFFKGHIDDIRIWTGARPGGEDLNDLRTAKWGWPTIKSDYENLKRYGLNETLEARNDMVKFFGRIINERKLAVDGNLSLNASTTNAVPDVNSTNDTRVTTWTLLAEGMTFEEYYNLAQEYIELTGGEDNYIRIPPLLLCSYTFDNLPDPNVEPVLPAKFDAINGRPEDYTGIQWLATAEDKTTVYISEEQPTYIFSQLVENHVASLPLGHLYGVGKDEEYAKMRPDSYLGLYQFRPDCSANSKYWTRDTKGGVDLENILGMADYENIFPNTSNPYRTRYETANHFKKESHPQLTAPVFFDTMHSSLFNDLVPLNNACADMSVQLWDDLMGDGIGAALDTDGDGLPDWWELAYGLDPYNSDTNGNGVFDAYEDFDGDNLNNYSEYLIGTDPYDSTTNGNEVDDVADTDNDGLSNLEEIIIGSDPANPDTDDDGLIDGNEVANGTSPVNSLSPFKSRYLKNDGQGVLVVPGRLAYKRSDGSYLDRYGERFDLQDWTIDMAVRPHTDVTSDVVLLSRKTDPDGYLNYELGISAAGVPYARFQTDTGEECRVDGIEKLKSNEWTFLGARLGKGLEGTREFVLFVNGTIVARKTTTMRCTSGTTPKDEDIVVSQNFDGDIDEVRIWNYAIPNDVYLSGFDESIFICDNLQLLGSLSCRADYDLVFNYDEGESCNGYTNFTVEAWIKIDKGSEGVIIRRSSGDLDNFAISVENGRIIASYHHLAPPTFRQYALQSLRSIIAVDDGMWHHVAFASSYKLDDIYGADYSGINTDALYIDGVLQVKSTVQGIKFAEQGSSIQIGVNGKDGSLNGSLIDEIRCYSEMKSQAYIIDYKDAALDLNVEIFDSLQFYFDFDDVDLYESPIIIKNRANPTTFGSLLFNDSSIISRENAEITLSPLALLISKLVLYLPFEDGSSYASERIGEVEDFVHRILGITDFRYADNDRYCGKLSSSVNIDFVQHNDITDPAPFRNYYVTDTDGDLLPDYWEIIHQLDPHIADMDHNGVMDAFDNFDSDELPNYAEFLAGLNPLFGDTDSNGIGDYDDTPYGGLSYGEIFTDNDYVFDGYEYGYDSDFASIHRYDAHLDRDMDGWDNWSESLVLFVAENGNSDYGTSLSYNTFNENIEYDSIIESSVEDKVANFPMPTLSTTLHFTGDAISGSKLVIHAYSDAEMNGWPDAVIVKDFTTNRLDTFPMTFELTKDNVIYGHLRQGKNWFFAWMEKDGSSLPLNGNNWPTWTPGEPAAVADFQVNGVDIGWDYNPVAFHLAVDAHGYIRYSFQQPPNGSATIQGFAADGKDHTVDISCAGTFMTSVPLKWPRVWLHEGDLQNARTSRFGVTLANNHSIYPNVYEVSVANTIGGSVTNWFMTTLTAPTLKSPLNYEVAYMSRPEFQFFLPEEATEFEITVKQYSDVACTQDEALIYTARHPKPMLETMGSQSVIIWQLPFSVGAIAQDGKTVFKAGSYYKWSVKAYNAANTSGIVSQEGRFKTASIAEQEDIAKSGRVKVAVSYPSKWAYSNGTTPMVQISSYSSAAFNGVPEAAVRINSLEQTTTLYGHELDSDVYLLAFIDQNGNGVRDVWEPYGYNRDLSAVNPFAPVAVSARSLSNVQPYEIIIRDPDTDNDLIPDSLEYVLYGGADFLSKSGKEYTEAFRSQLGLTGLSLGLFSGMAADADGDGINDLAEIVYGLGVSTGDTDGDGLNDGDELSLFGTIDAASSEQSLTVTGISLDADGKIVVEWGWDGVATQGGTRKLASSAKFVTYDIEATDSLTNPDWKVIKTVSTAVLDGETSIGSLGESATGARFSRVVFKSVE